MGTPILTIESLAAVRKEKPGFRMFRVDYFEEAGFVVPSTPETQVEAPQAEVLALVKRGMKVVGVREEPLESIGCLVVELAPAADRSRQRAHSASPEIPPELPEPTARRYRFSLDPSLNYAVRRREERSSSGELLVIAVNRDFARIEGTAAWLPRTCQADWYTWWSTPDHYRKEPIVTSTITVSELQNRPIPPSRFTLDYKVPGTVIVSAKVPGAEKQPRGTLTYRMPADPKDIDASIRAAIEGKEFIPQRRRNLGTIANILLVNLLLLAVVALTYRARVTRTAEQGGRR